MIDVYKPNKIYTDDEKLRLYTNLLLELEAIAKCDDPPNPFRNEIKIENNILIELNDTNDLSTALRFYGDVLQYESWEYIIVGEYNDRGYSDDILVRLKEQCGDNTQLINNNDWAIYVLNMDKSNQLCITDGVLKII